MLGEVESFWKNYNMNLFLYFLLVVHKTQLEYTFKGRRITQEGKRVNLKYVRFSKKKNNKNKG